MSAVVSINNLTDEEALTEGDPRSGTGTNGRYFLARNIKFSAAYNDGMIKLRIRG